MPGRDAGPPGFLPLAGHPVRWRLLRELARSDRQVRELTGLTGHPQPLVSYHLGRLRTARLVTARRIVLGIRSWQRESERRTLTFFTPHADVAAVSLHQVLGDSQTQSRPTHLPGP